MKKFLAVFFVFVFMALTTAILASASNPVSQSIEADTPAFVKTTYFDSQRGIISYSFNRDFIDEVSIKVLHTTKTHSGLVTCGGRQNGTNYATAGNWTSRADVRAVSGDTAIWRAYY